jgi:hypothetical protein
MFKRSKPKKLINSGNFRKTIHEEKKQVKGCSCTGITLPYRIDPKNNWN